jgi:phosphocarrier protein
VTRSVQIRNRLGLHARAAARFVHVASRFRSKVTLSRDHKEIDGKSILGILLLAASQGTFVLIKTEGEDEEAALQALVALVEQGFEEDGEQARSEEGK